MPRIRVIFVRDLELYKRGRTGGIFIGPEGTFTTSPVLEVLQRVYIPQKAIGGI